MLTDTLVNQSYDTGSVRIYTEEGSAASDYKPATARRLVRTHIGKRSRRR